MQLIGNPQAKEYIQTLLQKDALQGTLLFAGPEGVGKSIFALQLAQSKSDVRHFYPEGKLALHTMEQIKSLIHDMPIPPFESKRKFYLIHEAHRMLPAVGSALLKTLEEPPEHATIILITSQKANLLPTIISRCRLVPFFPIPDHEIQIYLKQHFNLTDADAKKISFLSQGSLSRAIKLTQEKQFFPFDLLSAYVKKDMPLLLKAIADLDISDEDALSRISEIERLLESLVHWFRDLHLLQLDADSDLLFHSEHFDLLKEGLQHSIPSLDEVESQMKKVLAALERNIKLKNALQYFFFKIW